MGSPAPGKAGNARPWRSLKALSAGRTGSGRFARIRKVLILINGFSGHSASVLSGGRRRSSTMNKPVTTGTAPIEVPAPAALGAPIFAPSAAGAGTSIGAVPVVTGLFIVELRLRPPDRTLAEWPENPLISIKTLRIRANRPEPVRPADNALRLRHGRAFPAFPGAGEPMALARLDEACFLRVHIGDQRVHTHRFGLQ